MLVAPSVVDRAGHRGRSTAARALVRVLGIAGAGYEAPIATQLQSSDEQTVREALRSLARIGTPRAALCVRQRCQPVATWLAGAAAETLWHFPAAEARRQVLELLSQRDFVQRSPEVAADCSSGSYRAALRDCRRFSRRSCHSGTACGVPRSRASAAVPTSSSSSKSPDVNQPSTDRACRRRIQLTLLKGLVSLRRLTGMYPAGHPAIEQKLGEIDGAVQQHLRDSPTLKLDVIHGTAHLDGVSFRQRERNPGADRRELAGPRDRQHPHRSRRLEQEMHALRGVPLAAPRRPARRRADRRPQLARRGVRHVSLGRLVPLDTRWHAAQWPDAPVGPMDPDYAESLALTERTFDDVAGGKGMNVVTVRDIVQLLIQKVAGSSAALGQILSVKLYENLTYCHSVNVATLSLLIGRQLGFDDAAIAALGEAALLHDIGKTRIPLEILQKPGALDRRERRMMEAHTTLRGGDPGRSGRPAAAHADRRTRASSRRRWQRLSRPRRERRPALPQPDCLGRGHLRGDDRSAIVPGPRHTGTGLPGARAARRHEAEYGTGESVRERDQLLPARSVVRTNRDETGIVIRTNQGEPLHPVIAMLTPNYDRLPGEVDTSERDQSGEYVRHVVETLSPTMPLDLNSLLAPA